MQEAEPEELGVLLCVKDADQGASPTRDYLEKVYPFIKTIKTAEVQGDVSSSGASTCYGAAQSMTTLETLPAMVVEEENDEAHQGKLPRDRPVIQKVAVAPAWGIHALHTMGYNPKEIVGLTENEVLVVRRCEHISQGQSVAAKCLATRNQELRDDIRQEYQILNQLSHSSIVGGVALHQSRFDVWLIMEYCQSTVEAHVGLHGTLRQDSEDMQLLRELAQGVRYLHALGGVAHRDLRPSSLLLRHTETGSLQLKIGGFSRARPLAGHVALGTKANLGLYSAPEVWLSHWGMLEPSDIWSMGMCMCFMLLGEAGLPVRLKDSIAINSFLLQGLPQERWPRVDPALEALLRQCLTPQPIYRPDASDLLKEAAFPGGAAPSPSR